MHTLPSQSLSIDVDLDHRINYAMQQNDVPVVRAIHINNSDGLSVRDLTLVVSSAPEFAAKWTARIGVVHGNGSYSLQEVDLTLSPTFLAGLTERVRGQLRFELLDGDRALAERTEEVELLTREDWAGLSSLPEILAAHVLPNHPAVDELLRDAAKILEEWTGDPSLSGYQTKDARRVSLVSAAIYSAVQRLDITYITAPPSFETEGQRIRLPRRLLETRMGNCLDLAAFTTACLEQTGLNALLVLLKEHAFVGVWLEDESFQEPTVYEPLRLRKRVDLKEILVFDPTVVTNRPLVRFEGAAQAARQHLDDPDLFHCLIDIARARKGQIRPLSERRVVVDGSADVEATEFEVPAAPRMSEIPDRPAAEVDAQVEAPESAATRLDRWKRKLLDLSLRNRLLNFRETKQTIPLMCPDLPGLEDSLAEGVAFKVLPRPSEMRSNDPRSGDAYRRRTGGDALEALLLEELQAKRLHTLLEPEELDRRLIRTYRSARLGMEEGGASALYLAIGFLSWYETEQSTKERLAPILLLPLELHRKSIREGFTLSIGDDEPRINITLMELLKQDFGVTVPGLDPLPEDHSGLDVPKILHTFRQAVKNIDRWDVLETSRIGIFSFKKFLMWRDLAERADALMQNAVVAHLVNKPDEVFDPGAVLPRPDELDRTHSPLKTFCPLPADSSQLAAVFAAAEGRSFVLEGPPGTGKSQTITNLIAHCLTEGKTVLFVSQKMAALNVVHDRLQKVGLGKFCLELHSNKARKREVLRQLEEAIAPFTARSQAEWSREAQRLEKLRSELNKYVEALHETRSTGDSVFKATSRLIGMKDVKALSMTWPSPDGMDRDQLFELRELVRQLATAGEVIGEPHGHPWDGVRLEAWSPVVQQEVQVAMEVLGRQITELEPKLGGVKNGLLPGVNTDSLEALSRVKELVHLMQGPPEAPASILTRPDWRGINDKIESWITHGQRRDSLRPGIFGRFSESVLDLDFDQLKRALTRAEDSFWPLSWIRRRAVGNALKAMARDLKAPRSGELSRILEDAHALQKESEVLRAAGDEAQSLMGKYWDNGDADWEQVSSVKTWAGSLRALATQFTGTDLAASLKLRERWGRMAAEGGELLQETGPIGIQLSEYSQGFVLFMKALEALRNLLQLDDRGLVREEEPGNVLDAMGARLREWPGEMHRLRDWCAWRRIRSKSVANGLQKLVDAHEDGTVASQDLSDVFDKSFTQWWHSAVVSGEPVLSAFFSPEHERKIEDFRDLDQRYLELTQDVIRARLGEKLPNTSIAALPNSEIGVLKREIGKKRRHMPVRKLFKVISNILPRIKPCTLMSPMSVAQYLEADHPAFDLVVFDEASQIPVWDAVGAIARGKQAIIVGDPKQLPPTSFFQRAEEEDTEDAIDLEVVEDLESILDDCMSARLPWLPLDWHYRSRHESLIAFSNYYYYDNRLLTFPSAHLEGMGVAWKYVAHGVYDRGKSATNRAEADEVVKEIVRRLQDEKLSRWSIGVVTFSQRQQVLVEDLLEDARLKNPDIDRFFSEEMPEPVFVKNLENVQGDERDVILFSICYGPDANGRVYMNFGPMNREGGERRLNVAITRARREVLVFSTLTADQIDMSRTRARGVKDLKNFLHYAEQGPKALLAMVDYNSEAEFESPFEREVAEALIAKGWEVHQQVGCSGYRIDLAIVDPDMPGRYLLGVECDGANYHRAKSARDRDKLRQGVLEDLGWHLHRIWSTDWWASPEREVEKVEAALRRAKEGPQQKPSPAPKTAVPKTDPVREAPSIELPDSVQAPPPSNQRVYEPFRVERPLGSQEMFYDQPASRLIEGLIANVVEKEGPVSLDLVARRVAAHWKLQRVSGKALKRITRMIPKNGVRIDRSSAGIFLWPSEKTPENYELFRIPGKDDDSSRDADDIPVREVENAALYLLQQYISVPKKDLARETARLFGFSRAGARVEKRMTAGVEKLIQDGHARYDGDTVVLLDA